MARKGPAGRTDDGHEKARRPGGKDCLDDLNVAGDF